MRFWTREAAGWLLVVAGLAVCLLAIFFASDRRMVEAWPIAIIGIFVFRGGIHLLKVAVAARVCQQAQDRLYPEQLPPVAAPRAARAITRTLPGRRVSG
jgi:xanthine/uracil permease